MLEDLDAAEEIAHRCEGLLLAADAKGRLPTPVEDLISAANLQQPDESLLSESAIREAPAHVRAAMRKVRHKVAALIDRKAREIHVSPDIQNAGQRRFKQAHEIAHGIFPWQQELAYADDRSTLAWSTNKLFEREANQGGAELLFQRALFRSMAADYAIGFGTIIDLANRFGTSYHAAFRRYVEAHRRPLAGVVLDTSPCERDPLAYRRHEAIHSPAWAERYESPAGWPPVLRREVFGFVDDIVDLSGDAPLGSRLDYPDLDNEPTGLQVELWSNTYHVFALIWLPRRERLKRRRIITPSELAS
jgi:Zn-dependent peptidase ImmA (M78 family)